MQATRRQFNHLLAALFASALAPALAREAAPALLLATDLRGTIDVSRYLVSEKYDGVRAYWTGKALLTRSGLPIAAPAWFTSRLPATPLDGELWIGRGKFEQLVSTVRKAQPIEAEWRAVRYMIFEKPDGMGVFADRIMQIQKLVESLKLPFVQAVVHQGISSQAELNRLLKQTTKAGGEGLVLHRADAPYVTGRSDALLKLKPLLDAEGVVVAHLAGKGKHEGRLGALQVKTSEGVVFKVGTGFTDAIRANPPPVGSTITYQFNGLTAQGKPRHARYLRVRDE
jgi:DNA ligase 1